MSNQIVLTVILFLCMPFLGLNVPSTRANPPIIVVPDDYPTIQEAINNAVGGDMISVKAGIYYEHVVVNKTVSLVGEDADTTVIDGNRTGHVVRVVSSGVNIIGFTVQHSGNTSVPINEAGIFIDHSTGCIVSGNNIIDNGWAGISLYYSGRNSLLSNHVSGSGWVGIHLGDSNFNTVSCNILNDNPFLGLNVHAESHYNNITDNVILNSVYGMSYHVATHNYICRNNISATRKEGISLPEQASYNVVEENRLINCTVAIVSKGPNNNNVLSGNVVIGCVVGFNLTQSSVGNSILSNSITDCDVGVQLNGSNQNNISANCFNENNCSLRLSSSHYNRIFNNELSNSSCGIALQYCNNNRFYHNNLINNTLQVSVLGSGSVNIWDDDYPSGGNYWSNYNGTDLSGGAFQNETGSDGIGDTACVIDANSTDRYPLKGMFLDHEASSECHVQTICNSTLSDFQFNGTAIRFNVSGESGTAGFCRACIPTALMNQTYYVFVNGAEVLFNLLPCSNVTHSYLYFDYTHSVQEVAIVPEFQSFLIPPLFILATLLAVTAYRKKRSGNRQPA